MFLIIPWGCELTNNKTNACIIMQFIVLNFKSPFFYRITTPRFASHQISPFSAKMTTKSIKTQNLNSVIHLMAGVVKGALSNRC